MKKYYMSIIFILADAICINIAYILAFLLRYEFDINSKVFQGFFEVYESNIFMFSLITCLGIAIFRGYRIHPGYIQIEDLMRVIAGLVAAQIAIPIVVSARSEFIPGSIYTIAFFIGMALMCGIRVLQQNISLLTRIFLIRTKHKEKYENTIPRVMIVGTGRELAGFIIEVNKNKLLDKSVVVAVDEDSKVHGMRICGVKIAGGTDKIKQLARKYKVDEIVISITDFSEDKMASIAEECSKTRCKTIILPSFLEIIERKPKVKSTYPDIHKLLSRSKVEIDKRDQRAYIEGKIVMVAGAAGSIGSKLAKEIIALNPRKLLLVDVDQKSLDILIRELTLYKEGVEVEGVLCTVTRINAIKETFERYKPHVVYYAAASKEGNSVQPDASQAFAVNFRGAVNFMELAHRNSVDRFILISDLKAFNKENIVQKTMRIAQLTAQEYSLNSDTKFSVVCFGHILDTDSGFLGDIIYQVKKGMPVYCPSGDIMSHFIPVEDAIKLIMEVGRISEGGEIFCLNMATAVNLKELTENAIKLLGFIPYADVDIKLTEDSYYKENLGEKNILREYLVETNNRSLYRYEYIEESEEIMQIVKTKEDSFEADAFIENLIVAGDAEIQKWVNKVLGN